jgi:hypothetical protein
MRVPRRLSLVLFVLAFPVVFLVINVLDAPQVVAGLIAIALMMPYAVHRERDRAARDTT